MGTLDTKLLIADALVQLCEEQPLKKVSISDIVERTGKNRKTFYYHFEDKNALIIWKFRYDLGLELQHRFPEHPGLQEGRRPFSFELPVLHHAEIGRALA